MVAIAGVLPDVSRVGPWTFGPYWWTRQRVGTYVAPLSREGSQIRTFPECRDWLD
ncbi:MAG: hypothetical protein ABEI77_03910 [Halorientalis sp.]